MYNFIDVNEASEGSVLPSEAMKINGLYIEDQISGYKTLNVKGREALSPDVETYNSGSSDGSRIKNKRYPERIITVSYLIKASSNEEFREAYNKLASILDVQDAELIFNDEPDKFFIGTPCTIDSVTPGKNAVVGEFEILCNDPFKYSIAEYEATATLGEGALIDYKGTYRAYPILEADFYGETDVAEDGETAGTLTGAGDWGYVAFFNDQEKIIQLGDPDEADGTQHAKSQTLMNQTFMGSTAWGTTAQALWAVNAGKVLENSVQVGTVAMAAASQDVDVHTSNKTKTLITVVGGSSPSIRYSVSATTSRRTTTSVHVQLVFNAVLGSNNATIYPGYSISAEVYVAGTWYNVLFKPADQKWYGTTVRSKSVSFTVTGLTASQTALTGIRFRAYNVSSRVCADIPISTYSTTVTDTSYYLTAAAYENNEDVWHGPAIIRQIGADEAGEVGAANFTLTYKQKMCMSNGSNAQTQRGAFQMQIADASGNNICGVRIVKNKTGKTGSLVFYVAGEVVNTTDIDLHYNNYYFGSSVDSVQTTTITKSGSTIAFAVGGYKRNFVVDALEDTQATSVTFMFERFSTYPVLEFNGLYWAKFIKNNCATYKDVPNKFSANDVLEANCKDANIYLNGLLEPGLGALGNDWEAFFLRPGINQIGVAYSEWVTDEYAPTFKVRYREVFL